MYEVKIISGEHAGHYVSVDSQYDARKEFGDRADMSTFRPEQPLFTVLIGDDVWNTHRTLDDARNDVAELTAQGRSAHYVEMPR